MKKLNKYLTPLMMADGPVSDGRKRKVWTEEIKLPKRGRPTIGDKPMTQREHKEKHKRKKKEERKKLVGVIDSETDPFDNVSQEKILPFLFVIHADEFEPVVLWDEHFPSLVKRLLSALDEIREQHGEYTFYAHNGGKFDFMFLIHELRGEISFKGRGIMSAKLRGHGLRDSFHVIPEKLANLQKEKFDYENMRRGRRTQKKSEIIGYCISDCKNLLIFLKGFIEEFGFKLSIGQAAMARLKESYEVEKLTEGFDGFLRNWFFGGRVECLQDRGDFRGEFKLFDVNSMYPYVMAEYAHPIGGIGDYEYRTGDIGSHTVFIDLNCDNRGALIGRGDNGETTSRIRQGRFYTTIWEYDVAVRHGLISNVEVNFCVDCSVRTDFSKFVLPLYSKRLLTKAKLRDMKNAGLEGTAAFLDVKKDDIFYKLLLNNAYGKFAQNPRNFKEHWLTDPDDRPPPEWFKSLERMAPAERQFYSAAQYENDAYWIWSKPAASFSFNNVGTAASITGAARAVLLDAICRAVDPIYCDTDSIICRDLPGLDLHPERLGAWDIEAEYSRVLIAGKKLYATELKSPKTGPDGQITPHQIKSKGTAGLSWQDMISLLDGAEIPVTSKGPTLNKFGEQNYITRTIRATANRSLPL